MQVNANGITINYQIDGQADAPWLIFSNSLATDLSMWEGQAEEFRGRFRILRYDQRGHGRSSAPPGRYDFDLLIADSIALMDALNIGRAHFCGLSMGGATAMGLAQRYPDRLDKVIVCDSPCASSPESAKQWEERIALAKKNGMTPLVEATVSRWFPAETLATNPPMLDKIRSMIANTPVNGFVGCAAALADHDFRTGVVRVTRPVLFLVGGNDGATPTAMRHMHAELASSRYVEIPSAGHISNMDNPGEFNRAIGNFINA